ncbi:MAG: GntR family transcriptional regulator [Bacteroidales bacterium]|nr:GntR family transcriptional regulator [Bacteroidales bacterium]
MVEIGRYNDLKITRKLDFGMIVDGGGYGEILVPRKYVLPEWHVGDTVTVFVYTDSEARLVATTEHPLIQSGRFAALRVKQITKVGAFLECGLLKDLLMPYREQYHRMQVGERVVVYAYVDEKTRRLVATSKVEQHLLPAPADAYRSKDRVDVLVYQRTELGYKVIVDQKYKGMLYYDEVFAGLRNGDRESAFVEQVRPDGKIDLVLYKTGYAKVVDFSDRLLEFLRSRGGYLPCTDKTDPETIYRMFGVSKKTFKKAVGDLYKKGLVQLEEDGIVLIKPEK